MGLFNTILQKLGFVKDKAVEAVAGENAAAAEAPVSPVEAAAVETVAAAQLQPKLLQDRPKS